MHRNWPRPVRHAINSSSGSPALKPGCHVTSAGGQRKAFALTRVLAVPAVTMPMKHGPIGRMWRILASAGIAIRRPHSGHQERCADACSWLSHWMRLGPAHLHHRLLCSGEGIATEQMSVTLLFHEPQRHWTIPALLNAIHSGRPGATVEGGAAARYPFMLHLATGQIANADPGADRKAR